MSSGYIYVLVNSSMPDLLKVGYSTRLPSERARELGASTGVPVPFIVAYECRVTDCRRAELIVHSELQARGFRIAENREFFRAPAAEAIRAILTLPTDLLIEVSSETEIQSDSPAQASDSPPWIDIWKHAESLHFGTDDEVRDDDEAMELYSRAAQLGCCWSYFRMAQIAQSLDTSKGAARASRRFAIDGVKNRNYSCYLILARISINEEFNSAERQRRTLLNFSEAHDLLNRMFELRRSEYDPDLEFALSFERTLVLLLRDVPEVLRGLNQSSRKDLFYVRTELIDCSERLLASNSANENDPEFLEFIAQGHAELKSFLQTLTP